MLHAPHGCLACGMQRWGKGRTASLAVSCSGVYRVWRNPSVFECVRMRGAYISDNGLKLEAYDECFRVAPRSRCFCGHPLSSHLPNQQTQTTHQELLKALRPALPSTAPAGVAPPRGTRPSVPAGGGRRQPPRSRLGVDSCNSCSCKAFSYMPSAFMSCSISCCR